MSKQTVTLIDSATQTASGQGSWKRISTGTMGILSLIISAVSSVTDFTAWLEFSHNGTDLAGEVPADLVVKRSGAAGAEKISDLLPG